MSQTTTTFSSAMPEVIRQSAMSPNRKATAMTAGYTVPDNPPDPEAAALELLVRLLRGHDHLHHSGREPQLR
jgi:hypothetical protein